MKIHGDDGWESFPSYLDVLAPRALDVLARHDLRITFFVVGQDAALAREPRRARRARRRRATRSATTRSATSPGCTATRRPSSTRSSSGPRTRSRPRPACAPTGSAARATASRRRRCACCVRRGYAYDASTLPTYIGPLARAYYFRTAKLTAEQRAERELLYGTWSDGRRAVRPYRWAVGRPHAARAPGHHDARAQGADPRELPPDARARTRRPRRARTSTPRCGSVAPTGVGPSILLHPLDLISGDDVKALAFFPGHADPGRREAGAGRLVPRAVPAPLRRRPGRRARRALAARDLPVRAPTSRARRDRAPRRRGGRRDDRASDAAARSCR